MAKAQSKQSMLQSWYNIDDAPDTTPVSVLFNTPGLLERYENAVCARCPLPCKVATGTPAKMQFRPLNNSQAHKFIFFVLSDVDQEDARARTIFSQETDLWRAVQMLNEAFGRDMADHIFLATAIRCVAPSKITGKPKAATAVEWRNCTTHLKLAIAQHKPSLVIGFGQGSAVSNIYTAFGLPSDSRGVIKVASNIQTACIEDAEFKADTLDLEHAFWVMRMNDLSSSMTLLTNLHELKHDFSKIPKLFAGTYPKRDLFDGRDYHVPQNEAEAIQFLDFFAKQEVFSFDIETGPNPYGLEPFMDGSKILGISFANQDRFSVFIPLEHSHRPLMKSPAVFEALKRTLTSPAKKCAQNGSGFDIPFIASKTGIIVTNYAYDTQLMHGLLNENVSHRLKYIAELYTDLEYYDDGLNKFFEGVSSKDKCFETMVPFDVLAQYAMADADATEQLRMKFEVGLKDLGLWDYFNNITMPDANSVITATISGMYLNKDVRDANFKEWNDTLNNYKTALYSSEAHKKWVILHDSMNSAKGMFFWKPDTNRIYSSFAASKNSLEDYIAVLDDKRRVSMARQHFVDLLTEQGYLKRNKNGDVVTGKMIPSTKLYTWEDVHLQVTSNDQLGTFLFGKDYIGAPSDKRTEKGAYATDNEILATLAASDQKEASDAAKIIIGIRAMTKIIGTYCVPFVHGRTEDGGFGYVKDDGLMHPIFIMTGNDSGMGNEDGGGTVTGRKSAKEPPIQVIKTRGEGAKDVKKMFQTKYLPGVGPFRLPVGPHLVHHGRTFDVPGCLLQVDFSQLEIRLFGIIAGIEWICSKYREGADLHLDLAMTVFNKTKEECLANGKFLRSMAKSLWFGPIYQQSAEGLKAGFDQKGFAKTVEECEELLAGMYANMPEFYPWKETIVEQLERSSTVRTVTGRRRALPYWGSRDKYLRGRALRQAINFCIQSPGADMTNISWFALNKWAERQGLLSRIVASVHDSLVWDIPPEELPVVAVATEYMMTHVPLKFLEGVNCPIEVDGDAGISWGDTHELNVPIECKKGVDEDKMRESLPADLRGYLGTGVAPIAHWRQHLSDHAILDPLKEFCSRRF